MVSGKIVIECFLLPTPNSVVWLIRGWILIRKYCELHPDDDIFTVLGANP